MDLLDLTPSADPRGAATLVVALDGWTDAGRGGTAAAEQLRASFPITTLGAFDTDALYDFRDRRPVLPIDQGELGEADWPGISLLRIDLPQRPVLLLEGAEPDFRWPTVLDDLVEMCDHFGIREYLGLGAVPGPVPHTRPVRIVTTSSDPELLDRYGRPHEQVVVPASCQVMIEVAMQEAGRRTLGMWARVPHYVAGDYPAASIALLRRFGERLDVAVPIDELEAEAEEHRERLDEAAAGSPEVQSHIEALEGAYDMDVSTGGMGSIEGPLPTGDQIAAELERFLRNRGDS